MSTLKKKSKTNIQFKINGVKINSLAELAIMYNLNKSTVRNRWNRGVRELEKLTAQPKGRNFKAHKILYHGRFYDSLQEFSDDNNLNCSTVRSRWNRGVRNPDILAKPVQPHSNKPLELS